MSVHLNPPVFADIGNSMVGSAPGLSIVLESRRFRSLFGVSALVCAKAWNLTGDKLPLSSSPKHLLWAFLFLKVYGSEHNYRILSGADEKTFRKWSWIFVKLKSNLSVVRLNQLSPRLGFSY